MRIIIHILHLTVGSHSSIGSTLLHHNISAVDEGNRGTSIQFLITGYSITIAMRNGSCTLQLAIIRHWQIVK